MPRLGAHNQLEEISLFDPPRGATRKFGSTDAVWRDVALLIDELDSTDRCVEYAIDGSVDSYAGVHAWLTEAIGDGTGTIRYVVDPDHAGLVRVDFTSISPTGCRMPNET